MDLTYQYREGKLVWQDDGEVEYFDLTYQFSRPTEIMYNLFNTERYYRQYPLLESRLKEGIDKKDFLFHIDNVFIFAFMSNFHPPIYEAIYEKLDGTGPQYKLHEYMSKYENLGTPCDGAGYVSSTLQPFTGLDSFLLPFSAYESCTLFDENLYYCLT